MPRDNSEYLDQEIRETAALICGIAACMPGESYAAIEITLGLDFETNGLDSPGRVAHDLAVAAYKASQYRGKRLLRVGDPLIDAEAEAKILSGWMPVVRGRQCCRFDHNYDGNCHVHSAPGVLRIQGNRTDLNIRP